MTKNIHEVRDPIHVFIRMNTHERRVLDSLPFQRLRLIHQLGLSHLVYPGATHKRFEHSLGVMDLAGRVFDIVTNPEYIREDVRKLITSISDKAFLDYWRRVIRMAALCHDMGHLPFSHTAEDLLPKGTSHELITAEIIQSKYLRSIWKDMTPPLRTEDIVKLSIGPEKSAKIGFKEFTDWEAILSEIIVGDAFGVDRIDYLLRDSYHAGVAYGRFDHYRLIDTLRILPLPLRDDPKQNKNYSNGNQIKAQSKEIMLGIEEGGLHSAESLLLARYFMFMQVYCHPVRRIYDIHLRDFLKEWLPEGTFSKSIPRHLNHTDAEIMVALRKACKSSKKSGYLHANRIINRLHFKVLYSRNPDDIQINPDSVTIIFEETYKKFGEENVRMDDYKQKGGAPVFPVLERDDRIVSSLDASHTLRNLPVVATGFVFIEREHYNDADKWLQENRRKILENYKTKEN